MQIIMKKRKNNAVNDNILYFCPKCLLYFTGAINRKCEECNCTKCCKSVLKKKPSNANEIPWEDMIRIVEYRQLNGYNSATFENLLKRAKKLGVCIPKDEKPNYIMKGLRKPRAQRQDFAGAANHAAPNNYIHFVNGGGCSSK